MSWYGFSCQESYNIHGNYIGFKVRHYKDIIYVSMEDAILNIQDMAGGVMRRTNPYAFYSIFSYIKKHLLRDFKVKNNSGHAPQKNLDAWYEEKVQKYWCKAIYEEWKKLLSRMDKKNLAVARALFAANFRYGMSAGTGLLQQINDVSNEHKQDIVDFVPAAMLAEHNLDYFIPVSYNRPVTAWDIDDEDEIDEGIDWGLGNEDWRGAFCHDSLQSIPSNLTETLAAVKPGIGYSSVKQLRNVVLKRPLLSKQEVVVTSAVANSLWMNDSKKEPFYSSDKENIITSIKAANAKGQKYSVRKTADLLQVSEYLQDYVSTERNMLEIADKVYGKYNKPKRVRRLRSKISLDP